MASDVAIRPSKTSLWATSWSGDGPTNGRKAAFSFKQPTQLTPLSFGLRCAKQELPSMHRYDSPGNRRTITSQQQRRQLYPASSPVLHSNSTQPTRRWRPENAHFYEKYYEVFQSATKRNDLDVSQ